MTTYPKGPIMHTLLVVLFALSLAYPLHVLGRATMPTFRHDRKVERHFARVMKTVDKSQGRFRP